MSSEVDSYTSTSNNNLWSAADRGDTRRVRAIIFPEDDGHSGCDVNARNCLGCTPLLYACGSGHVETVRALLSHPEIDVNRRNNDRLTSFMLAMQGSRMQVLGLPLSSAWMGLERHSGNAQEKMRRLMDLPATDDLEWTRHDRWTALMEASNFGHTAVVELLLAAADNPVDLDAVNIRGQRAEEVAASRGHGAIADMIARARADRENPEELPRIAELQKDLDTLKAETRQRLNSAVDTKYQVLRDLKARHETEMEPLSTRIDSLQLQLEEAMKTRLGMITRQVREIKAREDDIRVAKKKLDNFERFAIATSASSRSAVHIPQCQSKPSSSSAEGPSVAAAAAAPNNHSSSSSHPDLSSIFDKDFDCSVCLEEMAPPTRIFQCRNGHVMCQTCKEHPEVVRCPSCRIQFTVQEGEEGGDNLMRNIPMEKLARSFYERRMQQHRSRRGSTGHRSTGGGGARLTGGVGLAGAVGGRLDAGGLSQSTDTAFLDWTQ